MNINEEIQKLRNAPRETLAPIERQLLEDNDRANDKIAELDNALGGLEQQKQKLLAERQRQTGVADFTILRALSLRAQRTDAEASAAEAAKKSKRRKS